MTTADLIASQIFATVITLVLAGAVAEMFGRTPKTTRVRVIRWAVCLSVAVIYLLVFVFFPLSNVEVTPR